MWSDVVRCHGMGCYAVVRMYVCAWLVVRSCALMWIWRWCAVSTESPMSPKKPWDMHSDVWCGPGMQTTTRLRTATVTAKPLRRNAPDHKVLRCTTKYYYVPHNITQRTTKYFSVRHSSTPYKKLLHDTAPYYTALELPTQYCSALQSTTPDYKVLLHTRTDYSVLSFFEVLVSTAPLHRATLKPSDAQWSSVTATKPRNAALQLHQIVPLHDWTLPWLNYTWSIVPWWNLLDWSSPWLNCSLTELVLHWTVPWLNFCWTEEVLDWNLSWLNLSLTEMFLGWNGPWLNPSLTEFEFFMRDAWFLAKASR